MTEDKSENPPMAPPSRSAKRQSLTLSSLQSLRDVVAVGINEDETGENGDEEDDDFVFTDQIHQRQEIGFLSRTLGDLGFVHDEGDDPSDDAEKEATDENTPLLDEANKKVEAKEEKPLLQDSSTRPYRRKSKIQAYHRGQKESFLAVLDQVDGIQATTRKDKGFKEWKFTFGLLNCLLIAYIFGSRPEDFWILYAIETIFWMVYKFRGMYYAKPLCEALYYLDFCWVMNTLGVSIIVMIISLDRFMTVDVIPMELRNWMYMACFGVFCGPVFMASMVLSFVAFLFHDVNTMANLIIHLMPSMVMYNQRWYAAEISAAHPTMFPHLVEFSEALNNGENTESVSQITLVVYFAWFIPYVTWMLAVGLKLPALSKDNPSPKYDTVFHATWKGELCELAGKLFWKRPKEVSRDCSERRDFETRDFLLYMVGHAVGSCCLGVVLLGDILCYRGGKIIHATMIWFAIILCAKRGANRYTYYVTAMYGQKLRKAFKEIEVQQQQELEGLTHDDHGTTN